MTGLLARRRTRWLLVVTFAALVCCTPPAPQGGDLEDGRTGTKDDVADSFTANPDLNEAGGMTDGARGADEAGARPADGTQHDAASPEASSGQSDVTLDAGTNTDSIGGATDITASDGVSPPPDTIVDGAGTDQSPPVDTSSDGTSKDAGDGLAQGLDGGTSVDAGSPWLDSKSWPLYATKVLNGGACVAKTCGFIRSGLEWYCKADWTECTLQEVAGGPCGWVRCCNSVETPVPAGCFKTVNGYEGWHPPAFCPPLTSIAKLMEVAVKKPCPTCCPVFQFQMP